MSRGLRHPYLVRISEEVRERRQQMEEWIAANPEIAAAWDEAAQEDEQRRTVRVAEVRYRQKHEQMPEHLELMGCPPRAVRALLEHPRATKALAAVEEFLAAPDRAFLLLVGFPGSGKTVAGCAFLRSIDFEPSREGSGLWGSQEGEFVTAARLAVLPVFGDDNASRWEALTRRPMLVVDDLGVEAATDWWRGRLEELIDLRYGGAGLRTVITTNLGAEQFKKHYGERIARRIREAGMVRSVGDGPVQP